MRDVLDAELEQCRILSGPYASEPGSLYGAFNLGLLYVIFGAGEGWEHASVSRNRRCPSWPEMHRVKQLFWKDSETVIQIHPPQSDYVNMHPYCLHMWRPTDRQIPVPPRWMV